MKTSYKNYIQSLRAFSVLIVFFYHLNLDIFSKGYFGVDIFFVISGYVISQRIYKDYILNNKILIKDFFIRRLKRIFPVLIFVISTTLIIYIIFGSVVFLKKNFDTSFFSILGVSNIYFLLRKKNYFDTSFDDPLGHTWSLGVEEQFYIIYPLLLYLLFTNIKFEKEKKISFIFFIVSIALIILTFYFSTINPELVFYFPIFRFWEFLAGCILFFISVKFNGNRNNLISSFCFIIILVILFFDLPETYISYVSINLLVVIFSSLLIFFYTENIFNKIIFENKIAIFIGNISYSLYLWHLPVIYFTELYYGNYIKNLISLPISIFLSVITYHFIEKKFRYFNLKNNTKLFYKIVIFLFFSVLISLFYIISQKSSISVTKLFIKNSIQKINYLENKFNYSERINFFNTSINEKKIYTHCTEKSLDYEVNNLNLRKECLKLTSNNDLLFFIEGNSWTANFINMFDNSNFIKNFYYVQRSGHYFTNRSYEKVNSLVNKFRKIIYTTNINNFFQIKTLQSNIDKFDKEVIILILGPIPNSNANGRHPAKCLIMQVDCIIDVENDKKNRDLVELNKYIEKLSLRKNVFFFNPYKILCPLRKCHIYSKDKDTLKLLEFSHLSKEGSALLVPEFKSFYLNNLSKL